MTMRLKKGWEVGDAGAVYEFDIKLPKIDGVDISNDDFEIEAMDSIQDFVRELKRRYSWIGNVYQTGRSGGWLAIEDKTGGATKAKTRKINDLVREAKDNFVRYIKDEYPA